MNNRFKLMDQQYINTGGNCMVSMFTVYDKSVNATRYVFVNDEGINFQTADTVFSHDVFDTDEEIANCMIGEWSLDDLTSEPSFDQHLFTDEEYVLFKHCQFEFYKDYCKTFDKWVQLPIDQLPGEMYNELGMDAIEWHHETGQCVSTNGYIARANEQYTSLQQQVSDAHLETIKAFNNWHSEIAGSAFREDFYDSNYTITLADKSVEIPFDADSFSAIEELLKSTIKGW